jgi:hypothetical protein
MKTYLRVLGVGLAMMLFQPPSTASAAKKRLAGITISDPKMMCRTAQVLSARVKYLHLSWEVYGARPATTAAMIDAVSVYRQHACVAGGPTESVHLADMVAIGKAWARTIEDVQKAAGLEFAAAFGFIGADATYEIDRLARECGGGLKELNDFIRNGNGSLESVIGARCSGKTPAQIRTGADIFAPRSKDVAACVMRRGDAQSGCGSTVGDDDPNDEPDAPDEPQPIPVPEKRPPLTEEEKLAMEAKIGIEEAEKLSDYGDAIAAIGALIGAGSQIGGPETGAIGGAVMVGYEIVGASLWLSGWGTKEYYKHLRQFRGGGGEYCPSLTMTDGPAFMTTTEGEPMTTMDVAQDCLCESLQVETNRRKLVQQDPLGIKQLHQIGFCADNVEDAKLKCLENPFTSPDDGIRPECKEHLQNANGELTDTRIGELCSRIQCPPFQQGKATVKPGGAIACSCSSTPPHFGGNLGGQFGLCAALSCGQGKIPVLVNGKCSCDRADGGIGGGQIDPCKGNGCF